MIDIDKYLNITTDIKVFGEVITILEPTIKSQKLIAELTKDTTVENQYEMNNKITLIILNNNISKRTFTLDQVANLTKSAQIAICNVAYNMINNANIDPN